MEEHVMYWIWHSIMFVQRKEAVTEKILLHTTQTYRWWHITSSAAAKFPRTEVCGRLQWNVWCPGYRPGEWTYSYVPKDVRPLLYTWRYSLEILLAVYICVCNLCILFYLSTWALLITYGSVCLKLVICSSFSPWPSVLSQDDSNLSQSIDLLCLRTFSVYFIQDPLVD
jgi:hypothetical protein